MVQLKDSFSLRALSRKPQKGHTCFSFCSYIFKPFQISSIQKISKNRTRSFHVLCTKRPHLDFSKHTLRLLETENPVVTHLASLLRLPHSFSAFHGICLFEGYRTIILRVFQVVMCNTFSWHNPGHHVSGRIIAEEMPCSSHHILLGVHSANLSH